MNDRDNVSDVPPELADAARRIGSVPALDEVTRARLVRAALAATAPEAATEFTPAPRSNRSGRAHRWLVPAGSIAAAVALVAGIAATATRNTNSDADQAAAERTEALTLAPAVPDSLRDFGDVSDAARLRSLVGLSTLGGDGRNFQEYAAESDANLDTANASTTAAAGAGEASDSTATPTATLSARAAKTASTCLAGLNPGGTTPQLVGTGTHDGAPVFIATAVEDEGTFVFVFAVDGCRIVTAQLVGSD